ncbi:hypothetical protein BDN72DRAFT_957371, partial [Pluteus cervinus]
MNCQGMIFGKDRVIKGEEDGRLINELSGTIPYMSRRRLVCWEDNIRFSPRLLNDMEAAFWVMLLEYLNIAQTELKADYSYRNGWPMADNLFSDDTSVVLDAKQLITFLV